MDNKYSILHRKPELEQSKLGYSNVDYSMDEGLQQLLKAKAGQVYGIHGAYNFVGYIYYEVGKFHEEIWVHASLVQKMRHEDLNSLIEMVNDKYGYE